MPAPEVGARVVVPLGARVVTGLVVDTHVRDEPRGVKPIEQLLDRESFVPPAVIALAKWTAEYYACGVGDAIPALLPPMARGGRADAHKTRRVAAITASGLEAMTADASPKQREALEILAASPDGLATSVLAARGVGSEVISRLARRGYVSLRHERVDRDPWLDRSDCLVRLNSLTKQSDRCLTSEQL